MKQAVLVVAALAAATPLAAGEPFLTLPLDCDFGHTCYIEDYMDADPGDGQTDYACGIKSRDGHGGVDIALVSQEQFAAGVNVIAAAPGQVAATRDGMPDQPYSAETAAAVEGRECGNAVRITHENGLSTLYCHMRRGSIRVRSGQAIRRGDVLGRVGMSGQSNYPHVHLGVFSADQRLDPFAPEADTACGTGQPTLWLDNLPYTRTGMFTAGFSNRVPSFDEVKSGAARLAVSDRHAPLVLYSHFFYAEPGDQLHLRVTGPMGGTVFDRAERLDRPKASQFRAYGRKPPPEGWPAGRYAGRATLERAGTVLAVRFSEIVID